MPHFLKMPSFSLQPTGLGFAEGTPNRRPMHSTTSSFGARKGEALVPGLGQRPTDELGMQISWHFPRKTTANRLRTMAEQNQMLINTNSNLNNFSMKAGLSSLHAFRLMSSKSTTPAQALPTEHLQSIWRPRCAWRVRFPPSTESKSLNVASIGAGSIDSNILGLIWGAPTEGESSLKIYSDLFEEVGCHRVDLMDPRFQEVLDSNFDWPQLKHLGSLQEFPFPHKCYPSSWNLHEISLRSKGIRKMAQQCLASFIHII